MPMNAAVVAVTLVGLPLECYPSSAVDAAVVVVVFAAVVVAVVAVVVVVVKRFHKITIFSCQPSSFSFCTELIANHQHKNLKTKK